MSEVLSIIDHCQPHVQKKPNTKLRDLLKNKIAKTRELSELSKTEQNSWEVSQNMKACDFPKALLNNKKYQNIWEVSQKMEAQGFLNAVLNIQKVAKRLGGVAKSEGSRLPK